MPNYNLTAYLEGQNQIIATLDKKPYQGIQALLEKVYLINPDAVNALIEQINAALEEILRGVDYNTVSNKPVLDTNNTESLEYNSDEVIEGTIKLHKIAKTGAFSDLLGSPSFEGGSNIAIAQSGDTIVINSTTFVFEMAIASNVWRIEHNLNKFPSVAVIDSSGSIVDCEIAYINNNICEARMNAAFKGTAYLN